MKTEDEMLKEIYDELDQELHETQKIKEQAHDIKVMLDTYKVMPGERNLAKRVSYLISMKRM